MYNEEYEDLNKAKQKILYLLKLQYSDVEEVDNDEEQTDNQVEQGMDEIIKNIQTAINYINQMSTAVKYSRSKRNRPTPPYFRTATVYINFNNNALQLLNSLELINRKFQLIINNIGFVEPADMSLYNDIKNELFNYYRNLLDINSFEGNLRFEIIDTSGKAVDFTLLYEHFNKIHIEMNKIYQYDNNIKQTYNYKSANIKYKSKTSDFLTSKKEEYIKNKNTDDLIDDEGDAAYDKKNSN